MSFTSVPIRGQFVSSPSGGATPQGTVTFTLTTAITDSSTQTTVPATPIVFTLDASGEIPSGSYLTATDDPTTTPQGAYYLVEEQITGNPARYYALNVSRTYASAGIDLGVMDPVPVGGGFDYVLDPIPLLNSMNWRGAWTATTSYAVNDVTTYESQLYVCKTAHTSGSSFSGTNWTPAALGAPVSWAASTYYPPGQLVQMPTGGRAYFPSGGTSGASFTNGSDGSAWTYLPGGHYVAFAGAANWTVPPGIGSIRARVTGAGGGGGGGGSQATSGANQTGGGGGAGGQVVEREITLVADFSTGDTLQAQIGAGGSGGTGGAAGGNAGSNGSQGGNSYLVNVTRSSLKSLVAVGGYQGQGSAANSSAVAQGGLFGAYATTSTGSLSPGSGGPSATNSGLAYVNVVGGAGGATSSAGQGTSGYGCQNNPVTQQYLGATTAAETAAVVPGCGGGGGGAGAYNSAGANGGAGAHGLVELWF